MFNFAVLTSGILNGLTMGAIYALIALGLTLIYGVLHIINFAHGSLLMVALYGVYFLHVDYGIDPYMALPIVSGAMFIIGYLLQRTVISHAGAGKDENILLVTLGLSIILENLALSTWTSDTRTIETGLSDSVIDLSITILSVPKIIAFGGSVVIALLLWLLMTRSQTGLAIRAVSKERQGARLAGIKVEHIFALSFGIGSACLGAAACLLLPTYFVNPNVGQNFVLIAFTIVVLGGMGSFIGALLGGLTIGVTESLTGLFLGQSYGQLGIFLLFIFVLLVRPTGFFGQKVQK